MRSAPGDQRRKRADPGTDGKSEGRPKVIAPKTELNWGMRGDLNKKKQKRMKRKRKKAEFQSQNGVKRDSVVMPRWGEVTS